ncbi:MAG: DinB family protein, partial [Actinobacteria bacterium]|nr:DinB family protein [Actinomycetota bacterium]
AIDEAHLFGPDRKTPTLAEIKRCAERFRWIRTDTVSMVQDLTDKRLKAKPKVGRSIEGILEHVVEPSRWYIRNVLGPVPELDAQAAQVRRGAVPVVEALAAAVEPTVERLNGMTAEERSREVPHGAALWTARKMLRRLLEHDWEHHEEIAQRLASG